MNPEILNCQKFLHPEDPVDVTSEDIKPYLAKLGWEEGDKIPSGMQEYTAAVLHVLQKPVNMRNLPYFFNDETVIVTLKSALNKVKVYLQEKSEVQERVKELVPNIEELHPDTAETVLALAEQSVKDEIEKEAKIDTPTDTLDGFSDVDTESEDKGDGILKEPESFEELKSHLICPRCMFDITEPYNPYPVTDDDRLNYAYSILGGTDFSKSYVVANGLLEITYTTPSAHVSRLIEDQVKIDEKEGRLYDEYQFYVNNNRYGLASALTRVRALKGMDRNPSIPKLEDPQFESPIDTNLFKFTQYIEENIIKSGTRERFFRETYTEFMKLNVELMHTIDTENFLDAVLDKLS